MKPDQVRYNLGRILRLYTGPTVHLRSRLKRNMGALLHSGLSSSSTTRRKGAPTGGRGNFRDGGDHA